MPQSFRLFDLFSSRRSVSSSGTNIQNATDRAFDAEKIERLRELTSNIPTGRDEVNAWNDECAALIEQLVVSRVPSADLAAALAGLISYQKTGVTPSNSHGAFINAFCRTSGLFQELLHYALFPRAETTGTTPPITSPHFGTVDASARAEILANLRKTGYAVLPFTLDLTSVDRLSQAATKLTYRTLEPFAADLPETYEGIDPSRPPPCGALDAIKGQVMSDHAFQALANDPVIVSLASEYLETPATAIDAVLWYSFPAVKASSNLAQLFHYDLDTLRWLKVFYYLSDVADENGPHEYVEATHRSGAKSQELLDRGYARINDDDMRQFQTGHVRSVVGRAGTVIIGDTRAFHKGQRVAAGYRLIYSPIYAASQIGYVHAA